ERLVERAATLGNHLLSRLRQLAQSSRLIGEVRGLGLMAAIEFGDKESRKPYPADWQLGSRVLRSALHRGLITRARGDVIMLAPPLVVGEEQLDRIVSI